MRGIPVTEGFRAALFVACAATLGRAQGAAGALPARAPPVAMRTQVSMDAEAGYGYRLERPGLRDAIPDLPLPRPSRVSGLVEPAIRADITSWLSLQVRAAATMEGVYAAHVASGPAFPTVNVGVQEAQMGLRVGDALFLKAGVLRMTAGSDPGIRPTAWFARYTDDPYAPGATSFLGLAASLYLRSAKLSLTFLPGLRAPLYGLFGTPSSGSAAEARLSLTALGASFAVSGFFQTAEASLAPRYAGVGIETLLPVTEWLSLCAEGMLSNGREAWGLENGVLAPVRGSVDTLYLEGFAKASFSILSVVEISAGYVFTANGLDASVWKDTYESLTGSATTAAVREAVAQGYAALGLGADVFLRHRLLATVGVPRITDWLGVLASAWLSPQDGSLRLSFDLFARTRELALLTVRLEVRPSPPHTAYGSSAVAASVTAAASFSARESL